MARSPPRGVHRRLALGDDLGRRLQHGELPRRLRGRADALPRGGYALGFSRLATFVNVTLPIGGRIALPSSINTYISVVKNTSLMYVISYPELTTTVLQIQALTLETVEAFTVLAADLPDPRLDDVRADPGARVAPGAPGGGAMSLPDWVGDVARYMLEEGLVNTLKIAAIALVGSTLVGITLGTLLTISFLPLRAVIRALHRDLARASDPRDDLHHLLRAPGREPESPVRRLTAGAIALILWGSAQVAETTRGRSSPSRASSTRPPRRSASAGSAGTRS